MTGRTGAPPGAPEGMVPPPGDTGGFILALVVLFLFAIAVAATAGYQVVNTEFSLSQTTREGQKALVVARAGLERFLGEHIGQVGDTVAYAIGDGIAIVTARKVMEEDSLNHLYYLRSQGEVADIRTPSDPARRAVGTYAWHRISPLPHLGAVTLTEGRLNVGASLFGPDTEVDGHDDATALDCAAGGTAGVAGVTSSEAATTGSGGWWGGSGGDLDGNPPNDDSFLDFQAVYDTVGLRWDILSDPDFPVEFENTLPNFGSLPSDSFPLIRFDGNLTPHGVSGRGVLIVGGRLNLGYNFQWRGIILAGELDANFFSVPYIRGMLVGGLDGGQGDVNLRGGEYLYHSCNVYAANRSLSYLERVDHALFEGR